MTIEMPNTHPGRGDAGFGSCMRVEFIVQSTFISLTAFFQMDETGFDHSTLHQSSARRRIG
jgi:hypothetical protein